MRTIVHTTIAISVWLLGSSSLLLAHGGMSAEDVRPMALSGALALVSYWVVILWPKRRNDDASPRGPFRKTQVGSGRLRSPLKKSHTLKQVPPASQVPRVGGYSHEPDSVSNG